MACLLITTGTQAGTYFPLARRPLSAGRDPSQEIHLLDPKASRRHFVVKPRGEEYVVAELRTKNGVYVNGKKIAEVVLHEGDTIAIGDTLIVYHEANEPQRANALMNYRRASIAERNRRTQSS